MARPRDFDVDRALDVAVRLFWKQGYAATSVRQLCDAMGLQPGSFYAAFESKDACFRRALERYLASQALPREPSHDAIRAWLDAIVDPARMPKGCLLVVSAVERPMLDAKSARFVRDRITAMRSFFTACLADRDRAADDAALIGAAVVAIHVQARAGTDAAELRRIADRALEAVGLLRAPAPALARS